MLGGRLRCAEPEGCLLGSCVHALGSSLGTPSPAHLLGVSISCQISQLLVALPLTKQPVCRLGDCPCTASGRKLHLAGQSQSRVGRLSRDMSVMLTSFTAAICSSNQPHASSNIRGLPRTQVGG